MAEMGIPKIAASTSAAMYRLERITATGSIAGGPLACGVTACWPACARLLGVFESAIRLVSLRIGRMRRQHAEAKESNQIRWAPQVNADARVLGLSVDQTLIGKVARITVAVMKNVIATPIKIH